jgi:hypothetical protein
MAEKEWRKEKEMKGEDISHDDERRKKHRAREIVGMGSGLEPILHCLILERLQRRQSSTWPRNPRLIWWF